MFDLSFEVDAGSILAFVGPDGSGKSTALGLLATARRPDAGSIRIAGIDAIRQPRLARARLGHLSPDAAADLDATVTDHLRLHAICQRVARGSRGAAVDAVLELFELVSLASAPIARLAHGERRRVQLAAAFVHDPAVLLLDEPFVGIDGRAQHELRTLLGELADLGNTIVLATSHVEGLAEMGAEIAVLEAGRISSWGSADERSESLGVREVFVRFEDGHVDRYTAANAAEQQVLVRRLLADGGAIVEIRTGTRSLTSVLAERERVDLAQRSTAGVVTT